MSMFRIIFAGLVCVAVAACGREAGVAPAQAPSSGLSAPLADTEQGAIVARVQGIPITQDWLDALARARRLDLSDPAQRDRVLDELIQYAVLIDSARNGDHALSKDMRAEIELNALAMRANSVTANLVGDLDEATLRAEYEKQIQINGDLEYELAHLLFAEEPVALEAALAVKGGDAFDQVMATFQERAKQAVDLGWVKLGQLPPEFAAAVQALGDGESTAEPVRTSYGFHVIQRKASRPLTIPEYEKVREGIRRMLAAQQTDAVIDTLKKNAQIEIVAPGP